MPGVSVRTSLGSLLVAVVMTASDVAAQPAPAAPPAAQAAPSDPAPPPPRAPADAERDLVFDLGEIVVIGSGDGLAGVGGSVVTRDEMWDFDRNSLDKAVNIVPGVVSTF